METREQLLDGLYYVKDRLTKIQDILSRYIDLEREFRSKRSYEGLQEHAEEIKPNSVKSVSKITVTTIGLTVAVFYLFLSLITHRGASSALWLIVLTAVGVFARKKPKLRIAALVILAILVFDSVNSLIKYAPPALIIASGVILAVVIVAEVFIIKVYNSRYVTGKNRAVDAHNKDIISATDAENAEIEKLNESIAACRKALYTQYEKVYDELMENTGSWFPPDYYSMAAVDHFIQSVRNYKAGTVQEMVKLFDASQEHAELVAYQRDQSQKLGQIIANQEQSLANDKEQIELMRQANLINIMNGIQQSADADRQYRSTQNLNSSVNRVGSRIADNTDELRSKKNSINKLKR